MPILSKEQTLEAIRKAGISLNGNETWGEIRSIYSKLGKQDAPADNDQTSKDTDEKEENDPVYVWLKAKAYIDDSTKVVLAAGIYRFNANEVPKRLTDVVSPDIKIFRSGLTPREISEMARWCGLNPDITRDDAVLLEKCLSDYKKGLKRYRS